MKKKKTTFAQFLTKASAGAVLGIAAYMIFKTDRPNPTTQRPVKGKAKKEQMFI